MNAALSFALPVLGIEAGGRNCAVAASIGVARTKGHKKTRAVSPGLL